MFMSNYSKCERVQTELAHTGIRYYISDLLSRGPEIDPLCKG